MTRPRPLHLSVILLLVAVVRVASGAPGSLDDAIDRLDTSIEQHAQADPQRVLEAAAVLEHALETEGIRTAPAQLALGNAYFIGGDLGRAILTYRRGLVLDPSREELRTNLEHARSFVEPAPEAARSSPLWERIALAWRGRVSREVLWWLFVSGLAGGAITLTVRALAAAPPRIRHATRACVVLAFAGLVPLALEAWIIHTRDAVVVIEPGHTAYAGPGRTAYEPVYDSPLSIGTEGRLVESRSGWTHIAIGEDRVWVPSHAVERIVPAQNGDDAP